jgi:hypothetical protein
MIKNGQFVLKNRDSFMFKTQMVNSYLESNYYYQFYMYLTTTGVTSIAPFNLYYSKITGMTKNKYITDNNDASILLGTTNESSWKKIYTFGNCDAVTYIGTGGYDGTTHYVRGNMQYFLNQFPNLEKLNLSRSYFNSGISYISFPKNLKYLYLNDTSITGNISTFKNFEKIEELYLLNTPFTGNFNNINFTNLNSLNLTSTNSFSLNLNTLIESNPNFYRMSFTSLTAISGDTTNLDVSKINYIYWYLPYASNLQGYITDWSFNTGLSYFYLYQQYLYGDLTDWDFSNTKITTFHLESPTVNNRITGNLTNCGLPSTLTTFEIINNSGITYIPQDFSNTALTTLRLTNCSKLQSISGCTFPSTLNYVYIINSYDLNDDINDIQLNNSQTIQIVNTALGGDINNFIIPSACTTLNLASNKITGYYSGLTFNNNISSLNLSNNLIGGNMAGASVLPSTLRTLTLNNNSNLYMDLTTLTFNTMGLTTLNLSYISGITGDLSNFIMPSNITYIYLNNIHINSDLSKFNPYKATNLNIYSCYEVYGDLTNWLTGSTLSATNININSNPNLSGDTSNWIINNLQYFYCYTTALSGRLKHNNVFNLQIYNTNISSVLPTDFNFSNRLYFFNASNCNLQGTLSGVTLYSTFSNFSIQNNTGVTGSNEFIQYLFVYRKSWSGTKTIDISIIGDTLTGTSEALGDVGTYTGNAWNLTEEQINNLNAGTDYNGSGTNILWTSKQKLYWMKNAQVSSTNSTKRYVTFNITYS